MHRALASTVRWQNPLIRGMPGAAAIHSLIAPSFEGPLNTSARQAAPDPIEKRSWAISKAQKMDEILCFLVTPATILHRAIEQSAGAQREVNVWELPKQAGSGQHQGGQNVDGNQGILGICEIAGCDVEITS